MKIVKLTLLSSVLSLNLAATDLATYMSGVASTNPNILQKKKEFKTFYETLKISEGDWFLPSIDFNAGIDKVKTTYKEPTSSTSKYTNRYFGLTLTENLFNGYGTVNDIDAKKASLASEAYAYVQTVNEQLLNSAMAYINLARNSELLKVELDNYEKHKKILSAISARNSSGVGVIGDLQEITAKTNLAYSNYITQMTNLKSSQLAVKKFLGTPINLNTISTPSVGYELNYTAGQAIKFAFSHNPSLFVQKYNVIVARYDQKRDAKEFLPKVDLTISHSYHDGRDDETDSESKYTQLKGGLSLQWNLFRGFKDTHTKQRDISKIHQEYQKYEGIKRELAQEIELALAVYKSKQEEYIYLEKYVQNSSAKLNSITILFQNGRKSLFEFLASQTDYNSAKEKLINTKYDLIVAKLKVLKALGILPDLVNPAIKREVGIASDGLYDYKQLNYQADSLPLKEDESVPAPVLATTVSDNSMQNYTIVGATSSSNYVVQTVPRPAVQSTVTQTQTYYENDEKYQKVYDEEFVAPSKK